VARTARACSSTVARSAFPWPRFVAEGPRVAVCCAGNGGACADSGD
jgi:hypothetical protein